MQDVQGPRLTRRRLGQHTGFASPDNMTFSGRDELWLATDISTTSLNVPGRGFEWHGNNALDYVPPRGPNADVAFRFASAPVRAELTGPTYVRGSNAMFLSIQHPGEPGPASELDDPITPANYKSHWPDGGLSKPKPSVVAIRKP